MFKQASDARVAVFVAPGLEEIEGLTVVDLLFCEGPASADWLRRAYRP